MGHILTTLIDQEAIKPEEVKAAVLLALKEKLERDREKNEKRLKKRSKAFVKLLR